MTTRTNSAASRRTTKQASLGSIESLLAQIDGEKRAEANTEPGGYQGSTTHPSKDVDDRTDDAEEGARSTENTDDVKTEPNRGQPVDSVSPGSGGGQDTVQMDVGITSKATGEDASSETDSAKDGKQDPGSSHPARTDNDALDGHKYAQLKTMVKKCEDLGAQILARIAVDAGDAHKQAAGKQAASKQAEGDGADSKGAGNTNSNAGGVGVKDGPITTEGKVNAKDESGGNAAKQSAAASPKQAAQAGYDLAGIFADLDVPEHEKRATDNVVLNRVAEVIALGESRAIKVAEFLRSHEVAAQQAKAAAAKKAEEDSKKSESGEGGGGGGGGESGGGGGGPPPSAGGGGGGAPPPAAGGDPAAAAAGGDPAMGGGGGGEDAAMLEQLCQALNITPEQLEAAIASIVGGQGGGAGAMGGGGAPPPAAGDPLAAMGGGGGGAPPGMGGGMEGGGDPMAAMLGGKAAAAKPFDRQKLAKMARVVTEIMARQG